MITFSKIRKAILNRKVSDWSDSMLESQTYYLLLEKKRRIEEKVTRNCNNIQGNIDVIHSDREFLEYDEAITEALDWDMLISEFKITAGIKDRVVKGASLN